MFIFYFVFTKQQVLLICNENKEIYVANFDDTIEVDFFLGINIWGLRSEWVKRRRRGRGMKKTGKEKQDKEEEQKNVTKKLLCHCS